MKILSSKCFSSFVKGIIVEPVNAERQMKANLAKMEKQQKSDVNYPKNYATLYDFFAGSLSVGGLLLGMRERPGSHAIPSFFLFSLLIITLFFILYYTYLHHMYRYWFSKREL